MADKSAPLAAQAIDSERHHAWTSLVQVYQAVLPRLVADLEANGGLSSGVYSVLAHLDRSSTPGQMRFRELQERMRVRYSQPGLSRLVQRMEAEGLLERRRDTTDGRGILLVLTRTGRSQLRRSNVVFVRSLQEHFGAHVGVEEAQAISRALDPVLFRLDGSEPDRYPRTADRSD